MASNGKLPASDLVTVSNGERLETMTASAWLDMVDACRAAIGIVLTISKGGGGYRPLGSPSDSPDQQYWASTQWAAWNHYQKYGSPLAAYPGTSNHGWGTAADVYNWSSAWDWLRANSQRFSFVRDVAGENWHHHRNTPYYPPTPAPAPVDTKRKRVLV